MWISTAGKMIRYLTDERIDAVIDAGYDNLKAKNYAEGILEMLNETERYLEDGIPSDQYNYDTETGKISRYRSITVYEAIGAAVIALLCGGGFAAAVLGSYRLKRKTYRYPYESRAKVHFTRRDDQFRHRSITQRRIPREHRPEVAADRVPYILPAVAPHTVVAVGACNILYDSDMLKLLFTGNIPRGVFL
mgnify:FL=1